MFCHHAFFYGMRGEDRGSRIRGGERLKKFIDRGRWFLYKREK